MEPQMNADERGWQTTVGCGVAALMLFGAMAVAGEGRKKPWEEAYAGEEATGEHVLALWQFDAGAETQDASGKGRVDASPVLQNERHPPISHP